MGSDEEGGGLFETEKEAWWRSVGYKVLACTMFGGICLIWMYRVACFPRNEEGLSAGKRWVWMGMCMSELWFGFYWILSQSHRWNNTFRRPFKTKLLHRYGDKLPDVDIFVCTADASIEPPTLVVNTILSVISYNYPPEKITVYLSDDGCSDFTFYALVEASHFAKHWIPFCNKFAIEPRSPEAFFAQLTDKTRFTSPEELFFTKELYEEMKRKIEATIKRGSIPEDVREKHKGFAEWTPHVSKTNHQSIVQIIIDGKDVKSIDKTGCRLPTLVYLAREKRPQWPHNFKAGSMNALIRVSSEMSNAPIILNLDCDMYSNNSDIILESLCFFMDEEKGEEVCYVQCPQNFDNITANDLYSNSLRVVNKVENTGIDGYNATVYCGTGCFHRRESLCGKKYYEGYKGNLDARAENNSTRTRAESEEAAKVVSNCSYEKGSTWGKEMGLVYGCPVEDIITGLRIQASGWKPVYYDPSGRKAFLGVAPTCLESALVQHKRWCEGLFQIFISKYCPFLYGHGKIELGGQMGYSVYNLWAPSSVPLLFYVTVPSLCFLRGISLFPQVSSLWFIPFAYVFIARNAYNAFESLRCGSTLKAWWIFQQMWMFRRTSSYFLALLDTVLKKLGLGETGFDVTTKVMTDEVAKRNRQEVWEFGSSSPMFTILATLAILNLLSFLGGICKYAIWESESTQSLIPQIILCGLLVLINGPVYQALFLRKDNGSLPSSILVKSLSLAFLACVLAIC